MIVDQNVRAELALAWEMVRDDRNVLVGNMNVASMTVHPVSRVFRESPAAHHMTARPRRGATAWQAPARPPA